MKHQKGIILAVVLIFLLILSILTVSALSTSHLQMRMSYNMSDDIRLLQAAEAGLLTAEKTLANGKMEFDKIPVKYLAKILTDKRCVIDNNENKSMGSYFRLTSIASWNGDGEIILQSTYIQPTNKPCAATAKPIHSGRQSWRQYG